MNDQPAQPEPLTERITARLPDDLLARVDTAVENGTFPNRSEAIRAAVRDQFGAVRPDGDDRFLRECEGCGQLIDTRPDAETGAQHAPDYPIRRRRFPESLPVDDETTDNGDDEPSPDSGGAADGR